MCVWGITEEGGYLNIYVREMFRNIAFAGAMKMIAKAGE